MNEPNSHTPRPELTSADIEAMASFIRNRVKPLRNSAALDSEEMRAFQAVLDVVSILIGSAESSFERNGRAKMEGLYLATIAHQWDTHADYKSTWWER